MLFQTPASVRASGVLCLIVQTAQQLGFDHLGERVCQPGVDGLLVVDLDAVEHGLVPVPAGLWPGLLVGPMGI